MGHKGFEKMPTKLMFFDSQITCQVECPQDEWEFRFAAAVKACAFNSGAWKPLKYEALLWEPGSLHAFSSTIDIPPQHLQNMLSARGTVHETISDEVTVAGMVKQVLKLAPVLKRMDRSFALDLSLVEHVLEEKLVAKVKGMTLNCLAEPGETMPYIESMKRFAELKKTKEYIACAEMQSDIASIESFVCTIAKGFAPRVGPHQRLHSFLQTGSEAGREFLPGAFPFCYEGIGRWMCG